MKLQKQPNLFLIGGMRCGSTSLHLLLDQHPDIYMSSVKEPQFFVAEKMRQRIAEDSNPEIAEIKKLENYVESGNYREYITYQSLFENAKDEKYIGESSHYLYVTQVAKIIHDSCPEAKIIVSLRNPVERLYSEYNLYRREEKLTQSFREFVYARCKFDEQGQLLEVIPSSRIHKGFYHRKLAEWVKVFGYNQINVILFEDFKRDPIKVCHSVYDWLDIDSFVPIPIHAQQGGIPTRRKLFEMPDDLGSIKKILKKSLPKVIQLRLREIWYRFFLRREDMDQDIHSFLKNVYREDIEKLEDEFELDLSAWK